MDKLRRLGPLVKLLLLVLMVGELAEMRYRIHKMEKVVDTIDGRTDQEQSAYFAPEWANEIRTDIKFMSDDVKAARDYSKAACDHASSTGQC